MFDQSDRGTSIVYRSGALTPDNFTPRPEKDTTARQGQKPGLSASASPEVITKRKFQVIDTSKLKKPLEAFPDDSEQGGTEGHVAIAPVLKPGVVDYDKLKEWASYRGTEQIHPLTRNVLNAVVETDKRLDQ